MPVALVPVAMAPVALTSVALAAVVSAAVAVPLALVLPALAGTDGAAQVARADFWSAHPLLPLDLRWYGGVSGWGYSLLTPPVVAALGTRVQGALCAVVAAVALAALLVRGQVRRPRLGAAVGAVALCGNLPAGRSAFALGTALALLALLALPGAAPRRGVRTAGGVLLAVAAVLASPVAGLFLGLAGVAVALAGRRRDGLLLAAGCAVPLVAVQLLYGDGGRMPFQWPVTWRPALAALAVAALAGRRHRALVLGALLYAAGVLVTYAVPGALGSNVERLALLLAAPLLAATAVLPGAGGLRPAAWRRPATAALVLVATALALRWQATVPLRDLRTARQELPVSGYAPLRAALPPGAGRLEVVPLRNHGEAAVMARTSLLARGWERQVDVAENAVLYAGPLRPAAYRRWLDEHAVAYVALADAPLDWSAGPESALLAAAPDYLEPVPVGGRWRLWRVRDPSPLVSAPARLLAATAADVRISADGPSTALLRLRWSPLLTVTAGSACLSPAPDGVRVAFLAAGEVRVSSGPVPRHASCG